VSRHHQRPALSQPGRMRPASDEFGGNCRYRIEICRQPQRQDGRRLPRNVAGSNAVCLALRQETRHLIILDWDEHHFMPPRWRRSDTRSGIQVVFLRKLTREISSSQAQLSSSVPAGKLLSSSGSSQIGRPSCGSSGKSPSRNEESETPKSRTGFGTGISL